MNQLKKILIYIYQKNQLENYMMDIDPQKKIINVD